MTYTDIEAALIAQADAIQAQHPQYAGKYNGWKVATAKRDITVRGKVIVRKGQQVLFDPASISVATDAPRKTDNGKSFACFFVPAAMIPQIRLRADKFQGPF